MAGYRRLALLTAAALAAGAAIGVATRVEFGPARSRAPQAPAASQGSSSITSPRDGHRAVLSQSAAFDAALQRMVTGATSEVVASGVSTAHYRAVPVALSEPTEHPVFPNVAFVPRHHLRTIDYRQLLPSRPDLLRTSGAR